MNWDLFRFSLAKKLFNSIYKGYEFMEYGNDWAMEWWRYEGQTSFTGAQDRLFTLSQLMKLVRTVEGDMVECGVYRGQSSLVMLEYSDGRHLHVFDSFEGLSMPSPTEKDWWRGGDFCASEEEFVDAMGPAFMERVTIHKGWIPEKFSEVDGLTFSFVHVDVDLAKPTEESIVFFYPRLNAGGIMLFDDYGFRQCREVRKLVDSCFESESIIKLTSGQAFVMKERWE